MTAVEATELAAPSKVRDAFVIQALLQRLGSKNTSNEVKEAVSSSPRDTTLEYDSDGETLVRCPPPTYLAFLVRSNFTSKMR